MTIKTYKELADSELEGFVGGRCIIIITKDKVIPIGNCSDVVIEEK